MAQLYYGWLSMIWNWIKNIFLSKQVPLVAFGRTDTGKVRPHNEDAFYLLPGQSVMLVADGMGGHNAGEVASRVAIESMALVLQNGILQKAGNNKEEIQHLLIKSLRQTNDTVMRLANTNDTHKGMGCTFIAGYIGFGTLYTCHVGDVRGYILQQRTLKQITTDHTYANDFEKRCTEDPELEHTAPPPARNIVSRAIGFPFAEDPECNSIPIQKGARVLLCSDGLWSMLSDEVMATIISEASSPEKACDFLIEQANRAGGKDNITAAVAFV